MPSDADLIDRAIPEVLALAGAVRRRDYWDVRRILHDRTVGDIPQRRMYALVIVLAAAMPDDASLEELLAWVTEWPEPVDADQAEANRAELDQALAYTLPGRTTP